jgi:tetraprenyl-beta-curcumene synthase
MPSAFFPDARFLVRLVRDVLPASSAELARWRERAQAIPDPWLRAEALKSQKHKRFHADGGSVYAAFEPACLQSLTRAIVALQTISDYLDNLTDRADTFSEARAWALHRALRDAVDPDVPKGRYYPPGEAASDGGYLDALVDTCREVLRELPGYGAAAPYVRWMVRRYCELQTYKHTHPASRRQRLDAWWRGYEWRFPDLYGWEFAAASGSTLGMFALMAAAASPLSPTVARALFDAYFPWICAFHILLDYLIDLDEDAQVGDFNFVRCYATPAIALRRIRFLGGRAWQAARNLDAVEHSGRGLHPRVVEGLMAMYLSDPKAQTVPLARQAHRWVWRSGPWCALYYAACRTYRRRLAM